MGTFGSVYVELVLIPAKRMIRGFNDMVRLPTPKTIVLKIAALVGGQRM